jgi:hypothetical protein
MTEKVELTPELTEKVKQAAMNFRDTVVNYFKEHNVEIKDWKFAVESGEAGYVVDVAVKIAIKEKPKQVST